MECYPGLEALAAGAKVGTGPGGVTVVTSDPGYSGVGSCSAPPSQDYPPAYNSTYLSSGYCPQPSPALPPAPLHSLQSSYNPTSPVYNYPPGCYPPVLSSPLLSSPVLSCPLDRKSTRLNSSH